LKYVLKNGLQAKDCIIVRFDVNGVSTPIIYIEQDNIYWDSLYKASF